MTSLTERNGHSPLTAEEFERGYAERSGVTVEVLRSHGQRALPCYCGDPICMGWQMRYVTDEVVAGLMACWGIDGWAAMLRQLDEGVDRRWDE